jgi:hypothetical protein
VFLVRTRGDVMSAPHKPITSNRAKPGSFSYYLQLS